MVEAEKLAIADRDRYLADSDFVRVPVKQLLENSYITKRRAQISRVSALPRARPGQIGNFDQADAATPSGPSTTHLSIVDAQGNAVSLTSSIENAFGSGIATNGFLLNNELTDFAFTPVVGGRPVANSVEPGKRPRSSMAPTLVFDKAGKLELVLGTPGGPRIVPYMIQTLVNILDWKMPLQEALDAPHVVNLNSDTELENDAPAAWEADLKEHGQQVKRNAQTSGLHAIAIQPDGTLLGAADKRREGIARGQ